MDITILIYITMDVSTMSVKSASVLTANEMTAFLEVMLGRTMVVEW